MPPKIPDVPPNMESFDNIPLPDMLLLNEPNDVLVDEKALLSETDLWSIKSLSEPSSPTSDKNIKSILKK